MCRREDVHKVIVLAFSLLKAPHGWVRGQLNTVTNGCEGFCIVGAIEEAMRRLKFKDNKIAIAARNAIRDAAGVEWIMPWQDDPRTKKVEVLSVFDKAAHATEPRMRATA